jgi:serine/threonine protein kinase
MTPSTPTPAAGNPAGEPAPATEPVPVPLPPEEPRIIPRKTALGSYVIIRRIAAGGMGEVWEGWLIPSAELASQLLKGEREDLRKIVGVNSPGDSLTAEDKARIREWTRERTEEFLRDPPQPEAYRQMMEWLSPHRRLGQDYRRAIKILNPDLVRNPEVVRRFVREIEFLSRLNHPNIVKVVESGQAGTLHYAAMEYVEAVPIETRKFSIPEMTHVIRQALEGLIHAHEQGVLHRDLKPGNILVKDDLGAVKLTDFGIAKALDEAVDGHLTATGVIIGTPYYLDPERARGTPSVEKSDVYSLGATFYRLLTGDPPAKAPRAMDSVALIQSPKDPRWVREVNPRVSEELEDVVMMMLTKDLRYRLTTYEVRNLLRYLDENNTLLHREATAAQRRQDSRAARRLDREIRGLRAALLGEAKAVRVGSIRKVYTLYEDMAELHPRESERGINHRIDCYEEAMAFHRETVAGLGDNVARGVRDRILLLEKRWALEHRRLGQRGFKRRISQPRRLGRKSFFAAAGLLIVSMAVLFGNQLGRELDARRRLDDSLLGAEKALLARDLVRARSEMEQARTAALDFPPSSPRFQKEKSLAGRLEWEERLAEASVQLADLQGRIAARDYAAAAEKIEGIRQTLERPVPETDPALAGRIGELLRRTEQESAQLGRYSADLKVFGALVKVLDDLERREAAMNSRVGRGEIPPTDEEAALAPLLDSIESKIGNPMLVDPGAIGPRFEEAGRRLAALRASVNDLRARLSGIRVQAVRKDLVTARDALDQIRPGGSELPRLLATALAALERASGMMMERPPGSDDPFGESRDLLERLTLRQREWEGTVVAGKDAGALGRLAEEYRQRGCENRAKALLPPAASPKGKP